MKAEVNKLDIDEIVSSLRIFTNFKTKVDDLGVDKLKSITADLKKLNDVVDKDFVKKTEYNKLNSKVNKLKDYNVSASTLAQINQSNAEKQNLERQITDIDNKYLSLVIESSNLNSTLKS